MGVIYEPKGAAAEYANLAFNAYHGCSHGCTYCYAPSAVFKKRDVFHNDVYPKHNILERLEKDVKKLVKKSNVRVPVFLSFSCDPYQPLEEQEVITRPTIELLNYHGFPVRILTKAGKLAQRDFDLLSQDSENEFGVTLTLLKDWETWEPNAADPKDRINNLKKAHNNNIKTWISLEPILDVEQALKIIKTTHKFTNYYGIGKLNYHKHQKTIDWKEARESIENELEKYNCEYIIHETLQNI